MLVNAFRLLAPRAVAAEPDRVIGSNVNSRRANLVKNFVRAARLESGKRRQQHKAKSPEARLRYGHGLRPQVMPRRKPYQGASDDNSLTAPRGADRRVERAMISAKAAANGKS